MNTGRREPSPRESGFTLIELMVVVAIIGILVSMAVPAYKNMVVRTKETVLLHNLYILRDVIDQHYADKGRYPDSLDALVSAGYLRTMPIDPISETATWEEVFFTGYDEGQLEPLDVMDSGGVWDVKSMAEGSGKVVNRGVAYNEW